MWPFSSEDTCDEESKNYKSHVGDLEQTNEQWIGKFYPEKQDDDYFYGHREQENYYRCKECETKIRHPYYEMTREFVKVPKEDVPTEHLDELEVSLEQVGLR